MKKVAVAMSFDKVEAVLRGWREELNKPKSMRRSRDQYLKVKRLSKPNLERINNLIDRGAHLTA